MLSASDRSKVLESATPPVPAPPRSRRAVLATALGAFAGSIATALGRPAESRAAAGDPLILGQANYAENSATRLNATSSGGAFWMTQNGSGSGVRGESWNGTGGVFETHHPDRQGLLAQQLGAAGTGAAIRADGGNNDGLVARTNYPAGQGVLAQQLGTVGSGAAVRAEGNLNTGVHGSSDEFVGVAGYSTASYGVFGTSTDSYAGYFAGSLYASSVNANIKNFRLDHPLDPANQVLMHSCVESNERLTVYAGTVTADERGEAMVSLPAWFEALNTNLRYQLTPIGSAMPELHVKSGVRGNRFTIAGATPGGDVCWQLSGVRQDAYAKAHPLVVESRKIGKEKGKYLTPLEHGQPATKGVDYELRRQARLGLAPPAA